MRPLCVYGSIVLHMCMHTVYIYTLMHANTHTHRHMIAYSMYMCVDSVVKDWLCWRALNRLRTGVGRAKTVMRRWGYLDDDQSVDCDCGEPQTMDHLLSCRLQDEACTADDLATVTERAMECARKWGEIV